MKYNLYRSFLEFVITSIRAQLVCLDWSCSAVRADKDPYRALPTTTTTSCSDEENER